MPRYVSELNSLHPSECPVLTRVRDEYSDCTWLYQHGYIRYYRKDKKIGYEHQLVVKTKNPTSDDAFQFQVHHINRNRTDNSFINLQVVTPTEHQKIHRAGRRLKSTCHVCGKPIERALSAFSRRKNTLCSQECTRIHQRKVQRPTKNELKNLLATINNYSKLGRMFGVSDNAIRKWAVHYDIPLPTKNKQSG